MIRYVIYYGKYPSSLHYVLGFSELEYEKMMNYVKKFENDESYIYDHGAVMKITINAKSQECIYSWNKRSL